MFANIHSHGAMADAIRRKDWAATPLGAIEQWPETLRATVDMILAVPTPMQIFWGPELTTIYNDALLPFMTGKHPEALGQPGREVWQEAWDAVGPQIEAVFRSGSSFSFHNLPIRLLQNGVLEDMHWTFTYSPIHAQDGSVTGLLNVTQNTTEAVRAQTALRESEERFRMLVDTASVGVAIGNLRGELTYVNPALLSMLGYTADDVAHGRMRWNQMTPREFAARDAHAIEQLRTNGIAEPYEKAFFNKSGDAVPLLIGASVIPTGPEYGEESDIAVFAVDLRRQKRAEGALVRSEKLAAVGKLAASISHEINNPLEAVTNLLYIVQQDANLAAPSRDYLALADRELARVSQVTSQTLRFHRQSTAPTNIAPEALLDEVVQLYNARLGNFGIEVRREYSPGVRVTCYEGDIRQVLNNLVGNAIDAMRRGGRIVLRTRRTHQWSRGEPGVLLTVADNGPGMSAEVQRRIFEAFYTTKGINGTGLGLWISQRIVHKHRGYLRVHSSTRATRHGAVFHLWLPAQLADTAQGPWQYEDESAA